MIWPLTFHIILWPYYFILYGPQSKATPALNPSHHVSLPFCKYLSTTISMFLVLPQRQYIPVNFRRASFWWFIAQYAFMYLGSLFVIICLSFFLLGSWDYVPSVYGFM